MDVQDEMMRDTDTSAPNQSPTVVHIQEQSTPVVLEQNTPLVHTLEQSIIPIHEKNTPVNNQIVVETTSFKEVPTLY